MSLRTWLRSVVKQLPLIEEQVLKPNHDSQLLLDAIHKYTKQKPKKKASSALKELIVAQIKKGLTNATLYEVFGMLKKIFEILRSYDDKGNTLQADYTFIRKAVIKKYGINSTQYGKSIQLMKFSPEQWTANQANYQKQVSDKNQNRLQFNDTEIYQVMDDILSHPKQDWADLAIGIQLACGGRIVEILSMAKFTKDSDHYIKQKGIAKQHEGAVGNKDSVVKPVIHYSVDTFLSMVKHMREQIKPKLKLISRGKLTHYAFSASQNNKINNHIKKWFKDIRNGDKITTHMLRKIYGSMSYNIFADKGLMSQAAWLSNVLGHKENSLGTALSYSVVNVGSTPIQKEAHVNEIEQKEATNSKAINEISTRLEELKIDLNQKGRVEHTDVSIPTNVKLRDGKGLDRVKQSVDSLIQKGLTPTNAILRSLGYGSNMARNGMVYFRNN